jgi:hypothetical protein
MGLNIGPALIPAAPSHSRRALAGHATSPPGDRNGGAFTFLVGLAVPDGDQQAALGFRDVGHVKSD